MTEAEWLASNDPAPMLRAVREPVNHRKLWLIACGCWRRRWSGSHIPGVQKVMEYVELHADGKATVTELTQALQNLRAAPPRDFGELRSLNDLEPLGWALSSPSAEEVLRRVAHTVALDNTPNQGRRSRLTSTEYQTARRAELAAQTDLIRDIFGNPFRPVVFAPEWRTGTVIALAQQMYESRDFSAMPILADALQDAGCDSDDILSHCRGAIPSRPLSSTEDEQGQHVRGCWVVDLVLGRE